MSEQSIYANGASNRYHARTEIRKRLMKQVNDHNSFAVEPEARSEYRRSLIPPKDGIGLERVLGTNDLLGINFLELGLRAARAVCRIQIRNRSGHILGHGTGFMVSDRLLLTNHHVLENAEQAQRSLAEFNFEDNENFIPKPTHIFVLEPQMFFHTHVELDYTLVAVNQRSVEGVDLADFGYLPLKPQSGKALLGEYLTIIQHPRGGTKQIALRGNRMIDIFDSYIHYSSDTEQGSSGSPVFNDQWDVVALHHAGIQQRNAKGKVLAKDGSVWRPEMGEEQIWWMANEGIRISRICEDLALASTTWTAPQQALIAQAIPGIEGSMSAQTVAAPLVAATQQREWYHSSKGYDPMFLGVWVDLPALTPRQQEDCAPLLDETGHVLGYHNFSVVMSKSRRLAYFTAVNIDGGNLVTHPRDEDRWYFDPRIEQQYQSGPELYANNDLDRGHLVRRLDPVWGPHAIRANEDTFHFTNSAPQHKNLNRQSWLGLESYLLEHTDKHDLKIAVFTGPVFRDDDMLYRNSYRIPAEFWKVAVMRKASGELSATAYLQSQKNLIDNLEFAFGPYRTYQVRITQIESLTQLNFGNLRDADPLARTESSARIIESATDIRI
ncbi:MAG: DNA/RNA non-specific endonuclease [Bacteroidia bacterium]